MGNILSVGPEIVCVSVEGYVHKKKTETKTNYTCCRNLF